MLQDDVIGIQPPAEVAKGPTLLKLATDRFAGRVEALATLWSIVSFPGGASREAGAGVETNLLFFTKGQPTVRIRCYELSVIGIGRKNSLHGGSIRKLFQALAQA
jgi:hypothetical protein